MQIQKKLVVKIMSGLQIVMLRTKKIRFNLLKLIRINKTFRKMSDLLILNLKMKIQIKIN